MRGSDGRFSWPDEWLGTSGKVERFEAQGDEEAVMLSTTRRLRFLENSIGLVLGHRRLDALQDLVVLAAFQMHHGEDEAESGRRVAHNVLDVVPVLDLGGVLLARDHRTLAVVDAILGEEHLRPRQGNVLNALHAGTGKAIDLAARHVRWPALVSVSDSIILPCWPLPLLEQTFLSKEARLLLSP